MLKQTLLAAAKAGGDVMMSYFNGSFKISNKEGMNNLVTEADYAAEKAIFETIRTEFPDHYLLSEEAGEVETSSNYKWIIDPIDGTINFAHGIPICCVSIGLEKDGEIIMGTVYSPALNEWYVAEKGQGATLNDKPIQVSKKENIEHACMVTGFPYTYLDEPNGPLQCFERFIRKGVPVRRLGSAALDLCWV
ncbi:MAG: inositol monophosphatase, partial [Hymenobacter sp.]